MRVEFDRQACDGWFMCIEHLNEFEMNISEGKANLVGSEQTDGEIFVLELPNDRLEEAMKSANACPENAIRIFDSGRQLYPE